MSETKDYAIAKYKELESGTHDDIITFASECENGAYGDVLASHMLMMMSWDRTGQIELAKFSEKRIDRVAKVVKKKKLLKGNPFSAKDARAARDAMLECEKYDVEAIYNFMATFDHAALTFCGI